MRRAIPVMVALLAAVAVPSVLRAQEPANPGTAATQQHVEHAVEKRTGNPVEAPEHASAGHDDAYPHVPWYKNMELWKFINMGLILLLVFHMVGGSPKGSLQRRSDKIRHELDEARHALETAETRLDDAELRLARLHDELERMREEGRQAAASEKARIIDEARRSAEDLGRRTQRQIEVETLRAKRELREHMASLIVRQVREELQGRIEREGDAPFVNTILQKVEALG
jgi:F-type H+-transporting ATPase subunit b